MSSFLLISATEGFSLQPVVTASLSILKDLTPLLATDSSLGKDVTEELKQVLEHFINAVKCISMTFHYFGLGLRGIQQSLAFWDDPMSSVKLSLMLKATRYFRYAHGSASDAKMAYTQAKEAVESLLKKSLESFGSDAVVEVSSKNVMGQLNVRKSSLQNMGTNVMFHLERSETTTEGWIQLLREIDQMLVCFLGDEKISLAQPLTSIPIWSANPMEIWELLNSDVVKADIELSGNVRANPTWFKWRQEDQAAYRKKDLEAREGLITDPDVKLHVPKDVTNTHTPIPSQILEGLIDPSGVCAITLKKLERVKDGVSCLTFGIEINGPLSKILQHLVIRCRRANDKVHARLADLEWKGIEDVPTSSKWWLRHSKPRVKTSVTEGAAEWDISRPLFHWNFVFPLTFTLSLNIAYEEECELRVDAQLGYREAYGRNELRCGSPFRLPSP